MLVVPKPIFSRSKTVKGYYLSFQTGNALLEEGKTFAYENSISSPFIEFVNQIGLEVLTNNLPIFIPVSNVQLATNLEEVCTVDRTRVALLLGRRVDLSAANIERVKYFKEQGFMVAFIHKDDYRALDPFLPYTDFIFSGSETSSVMPLLGHIRQKHFPTKVIARKITSEQIFEKMMAFGLEYFAGSFYMHPQISKDRRVSPLKINYIHLLNQVNQEDFDLDKFAGIVQRDTALAIQFLKMVNSSSVRANKITNLRHAAVLLGQREIKKWATTAVTSSLAQESPGEITRVSMLRAKFCENLAGLFELAVQKENLFLMGLFSVLDIILETTMEDALNTVRVPDRVRDALLMKEPSFGEVYEFIRLYEKADWVEVSRTALMKGFSIADIFNAYNSALTWYGQMIHMEIDENGVSL
jgi:EAL and modified HD-GYP domain-containing signal transduction protein